MSSNSEEHPNFCAPIIAIGREEVVLDNENSKITSEGKKSHGFHLVRSKWDPYPWIDSVESGSSADISGLRSGDCLLEIDNRDVLGLEMKDIAHLIGEKNRVNLSIWRRPSEFSMQSANDEEFINLNAKDITESPDSNSSVDRGSSLLDGPLPEVSRRLVRAVSGVVKALECPVCLESAAPPVSQCVHGHLLCFGCRLKSSRCPVCRVRLGQGRCLLADKTHRALSEALVRPRRVSSSSSTQGDSLIAPSRSLHASIFGSSSATTQKHNPSSSNGHHQNEQKQRQRKERSPMRQFLHRLVHSSSSSSSSPGLLSRSFRRRAKDDDDNRATSTESLPADSSHRRNNTSSSRKDDLSDRELPLNRSGPSSSSSTCLATSKIRHDNDENDDDENDAGCSMDGNLLYGRRWLLRLYDRRKSASTGELHRSSNCRKEHDKNETIDHVYERITDSDDFDNDRQRRRPIQLGNLSSSCLLSVPQTPTWGGSTESMIMSKLCCPLKYTKECKEMVHKETLMAHLQESHGGPIIYFYKSDIILPYPLPFHEEAVYVMCLYDNIFILQNYDNNIWMSNPKADNEIQFEWSIEVKSASKATIAAKKTIVSLQEPYLLSSHSTVIIPKDFTGYLQISVVRVNSQESYIDI
ncbi:hypothetical protein QAD02_022583 [Eretmocerus hayati]|uniref:Uncharacterized protein n=1 Tax=Eretmocerus hayati TaxID=131215 RepID=A0ACC2PU24_9HYME|nr:hypothetical protein QAD02_022583 [Eretmocerus hayati]